MLSIDFLNERLKPRFVLSFDFGVVNRSSDELRQVTVERTHDDRDATLESRDGIEQRLHRLTRYRGRDRLLRRTLCWLDETDVATYARADFEDGFALIKTTRKDTAVETFDQEIFECWNGRQIETFKQDRVRDRLI